MTAPSIDVYPVGLLADLIHHRGARRIIRTLRERRTRASLRSYLNGYLAEINYPPRDLRHTRCGHGWTQRRALARLGIYLAEDNPGQGIAGRHPSRSARVLGPIRAWTYTLRKPNWGIHLTWKSLDFGRGTPQLIRALDIHLGRRGLAIVPR